MVELVQAGRTPSQLAREFGCTAQSISTWVAQAAADSGKPTRGKDVLSSAEREELVRQHVGLEAVAGAAGGDEVAGGGDPALRERMDMVERRDRELERRAAVHAAAATVTHGRALGGALQVGGRHAARMAVEAAGRAWEGDPRKGLASGQCHLAGKDDTPLRVARAGCKGQR